MSTPVTPPTIQDADAVVAAARELTGAAVASASELTRRGEAIDEHQVPSSAWPTRRPRPGRGRAAGSRARPRSLTRRDRGRAELARSARDRLAPIAGVLGLDALAAYGASAHDALRRAGREALVRANGRDVAAERRHATPGRSTRRWPRCARACASSPSARSRRTPSTSTATTSWSPSAFITEMGELGYFGLSIPEKYGGHELGNLAMILTTEELSRASLAAAGSLITRPEILAKALLAGGTEAQKQLWLPRHRRRRAHGRDLA